MGSKLDTQLAKYQSNAWSAMFDHLARHLGVSADSLKRLKLGWAPVVEFKKGANHQGWWVIPERNATAEPVGLSLRSQSDFKCMYPGSKHGLVYEPNPDHVRGSAAYEHGAHNWVRLYDAEVECPICGKPDGCLVSSEDPDDPQACICIRVKEGSERPMKFGHLHVLKDEGNVKGAHPLPPSTDPVVVVEGMTDTAAAMDLGLVAVGRPSNLAGLDVVRDLVRNREVIVVGENDKAGREGMAAAFQMLKEVTKDIRQVLPPEHFKDLRQWKNGADLTKEEFLAYAEEEGREEQEQKVLPDTKPLTAARAFLDSKYRMAGRYILRNYKDQWMLYNGVKYEEVKPEVHIRGPLYGWADDKMVIHTASNGEEQIRPLQCDRGTVNNIMDSMNWDCPVDSERLPTWINGADGPNPNDLIVFQNGVLWVSKYLDGAPEREYLLDLTPDLFNTFALPYSFDPTAKCPQWRGYLRSALADDPGKPRLLREWSGYCLTPDTSLHKMMLFRGPTRSGKSTALDVLQAIVGTQQCVSVSFTDLVSNFGLSSMVGKQLAVMGDARLPTRTDNMRALELLLNIVGEDPVQVDRKYLSPLENHRMQCKFTISTNELPSLPDHSGALEARLNILDFNKSFVGKEDFNLRQKLIAEAPGIIVWALEGLRRLREQGRFTLPESSKESLREFRTATSPMAAFVEECCEQGPDLEVDKTQLYDAWSTWSDERGMRTLSKSRFGERIKANAQHARSETYEKGGHKFSVYKGLKLKPWAERKLLGKP